MAIASLSEYKAWAGITGSSEDSILTTLLSAAQAAMERLCGRQFDEATVTETVNGTGGETIQIRRFPVSILTDVEVRTGLSSWSELDPSTYRLVPETGILYSLGYTPARVPVASADLDDLGVSYSTFAGGGCWPSEPQSVRLSYVGGYSAAAMPADLKVALYRMVDGLYAARRRDMAVKAESIGAYSVTYATPDEAAVAQRALLAPYMVGAL